MSKTIMLTYGEYEDYRVDGIYIVPDDFNERKFREYAEKQGKKDFLKERVIVKKEIVEKSSGDIVVVHYYVDGEKYLYLPDIWFKYYVPYLIEKYNMTKLNNVIEIHVENLYE